MGFTKSNFTTYSSPQFRILSDAQIYEIYLAALEVLPRSQYREGLELLAQFAVDRRF